jgi:hypothetical protein
VVVVLVLVPVGLKDPFAEVGDEVLEINVLHFSNNFADFCHR